MVKRQHSEEDGLRKGRDEAGTIFPRGSAVRPFGADDEWEVLATEQPFYQIVSDPDGKPLFIYVGTLDGLWKNRSTRKLWLPDHKTTNKSRIDTRYLRLDEQASAYWTWGVDWLYDNRILRPRQQLAGMIFNFLRKAMPDDRPKNEKGQSLNKDGGISKKQPPPYFVRHPVYRDEFEKGQVRSRALREFYRMQRMRNGEEVPDKSPSQMNCPFCHLLDICELHETGNDYQELIDGTLVHYDPYTTYEIEGERR